MEMIARYVATAAARNLSWLLTESVPYGNSTTTFVCCSFDLVAGGGCSPQKSSGNKTTDGGEETDLARIFETATATLTTITTRYAKSNHKNTHLALLVEDPFSFLPCSRAVRSCAAPADMMYE